MKRLAIFVSGGGTDMQSVLDAISAGELVAEVAVVIASKPGIGAIDRAKAAGVPYEVFCKSDYDTLSDMFAAIVLRLGEYAVDYVVLAGYLSVLTPNIIEAYRERIVNIHPSLIPKYCGDGFYGMRVHRAVIEARERVSGATVHLVDEGTDTGRILAQIEVPVLENDTPETLQKRVLEAEHKLLPATLQKLLNEN